MTKNMDDGRKSLFSKLNRLDSTMKYLGGKQNSLEERSERQCLSMDFAMKEAQFKGSLLDRITWLEQRLHKLSMQLETGSVRTDTPAGETSSSSFPLFTTSHPHTSSHFQVKSDKGAQKQKHPTSSGKKKRANKEDKTSKRGKKERPPPIWPRFKILGC